MLAALSCPHKHIFKDRKHIMEISFINDEYSSHLEDSLHFAQKNNLRYIELRNVNSRNICDFSLAEAADMAHKIQSSGILVSSIASPFLNWATDTTDFNICGQKVADEAAYFTQLMDLADIFGAPNINIYSYLKNDTISMEELGKKLDIYSQMALERGISLLLENDAKCNISTINSMHQLLELYGFSNIFPLLNLGNTIAMADDFKPQDLQDIINKCQYFHLKDYDAELKRNVVIGEGNIDYEDILQDKLNDTDVVLSLDTATGYPEDLQMSLNMVQAWE